MERELITEDDVDAMGFGGGSAERIATLLSWVRDEDRFELGPGLSAEYPLSMAVGYLMDAGDFDTAWQVAVEASRHPTTRPFEAHPTMIDVRLRQGRPDDAIALADELRASSHVSPLTAEIVAENFEMADMTRDALRWFTIGLRLAEQHETGGASYPSLLMGRFRVRRDAGMPWDGIDYEAAEWRAQRQEDDE